MLQSVPDHVLVDLIDQYLDDRQSLGRTSQVCRSLNDTLCEPSYWRTKLIARFGPDASLYHPQFRERFDSSISTTDSEDGGHPKDVYGATHVLEQRFTSGSFCSRGRVYHSNPITCIVMDGSNVYVTDNSGQVLLLCQGEEPTLIPFHSLPSPSSCISIIKNERFCAGHLDGCISWFGIEEPASIIQVHSGRVTALSQLGSLTLSVSSKDQSLRLTDAEKQTECQARKLSADAAPNTVAALSENSAMVGCRDDRCRVYDFRVSGLPVQTIELIDWCLCVEAAPNNPFHVRASDKAVHLFDLRTIESPIETRHMNRRLISKFKSDSTLRLVSCSLDGHLRVSSLENADSRVTSLFCSDDFVLATDFDRTNLCCGGMNGKLELFTFHVF
jgi:hypothetical protein